MLKINNLLPLPLIPPLPPSTYLFLYLPNALVPPHDRARGSEGDRSQWLQVERKIQFDSKKTTKTCSAVVQRANTLTSGHLFQDRPHINLSDSAKLTLWSIENGSQDIPSMVVSWAMCMV